MTYPPQSPEPNPHGAGPGPGAPGQGPGPSPDLLVEWGIKENPNRPKKINQFTQALWAYAAATVLILIFAILASATAPWWYATGFLVGGAVFNLLWGAGAVVVVWLVAKERLGVFGATDARVPLYIALGVLGFFSLGGFFGVWAIGWFAALGSLLALVKLAAIGAAFYLLFQPDVAHWIRSRPGNQPKPPVPPQHPGNYPPQPPNPGVGHQQPPSSGGQ
ncbi:hypothetical protein AB0B28_07905 [Glycomyces sp. NPDC046736]|uniref:hypothetical protein n=1 Tax=Glycomyces sp. NPDC046736 TaxID=3155615 RepID=UPI0033E29563